MMEPEFSEVEESPLERKVNDLIDEWHMGYDGPLELIDYVAKHMDWTKLQAAAWLYPNGVKWNL